MHFLKAFLLISILFLLFFSIPLSLNVTSAVPEPDNDGSLLDRMIERSNAKTQIQEDQTDHTKEGKADDDHDSEDKNLDQANEDEVEKVEEEKPNMDFESGQALTDKKAQETSLVTVMMPEDDTQLHLAYHAFVERSTDPIMIRFKPSSTCSPGGKNLLWFNIDIWPISEEECPSGMAICYPGKLDPINKNNPGFSESIYALKNNRESEAFTMCNKNKPQSWDVWGNSELHGIMIKSETKNGYTQVRIMSSFTDESFTADVGPDERINVKIGTESGMIGEMAIKKGEEIIDYVGRRADWAKLSLANGLKFVEFMPNVIPIDMMLGYTESIPSLRWLETRIVESIWKFFLSGKDGVEVVFGILTETPEPPEFYLFYPTIPGCTIQGDFKSNMFVLAYNGRPDCYMRLAWGARRIFYVDRMDKINSVGGMHDMRASFRGENRDQLWVIDNIGEDQPLGRGTCGIEGQYLGKNVFSGLGEFKYLWRFIINPKRANEVIPYTKPAKCDLGVMIYLDEYMITLAKDNPGLDEEEDDDEEN